MQYLHWAIQKLVVMFVKGQEIAQAGINKLYWNLLKLY